MVRKKLQYRKIPKPTGGFRPGSGRKPGWGRIPKDKDDRAAFGAQCRSYCQKALEAVIKILDSPKTSAALKLQAAFGLMDRGFGRPAQAHEVYGLGGGPIVGLQLTPAQLQGLPDDVLANLDLLLNQLGRGQANGGGGEVSTEVQGQEFAATVGYSGSA